MTTPTFTHKRGNTFEAWGYETDNAKLPIDLTGATIDSQIRTNSGTIISTLTVTLEDQLGSPGKYHVEPVQTDDWPLVTLYWDVKITLDGSVFRTQTVLIVVVKEITD